MIKVHILDRCEYYEGQAYLSIGEADSYTGEKYMQYEPCPQCQGSGKHSRWVCLKDFADLLERAISIEPDYQEVARHEPTSQYKYHQDVADF